MITTVAGNGTKGFSGDNGPATSAQLSDPSGVAVDSAGNLYIADMQPAHPQGLEWRDHHRGGKRDGGLQRRQRPGHQRPVELSPGVAVDSAGNLYIADYDNYRIRKVSNGVITTVAGNGTEGYSGDNGPATSAQLSYPSRRRGGFRRQPVHRRQATAHPQGLEWGDRHRGGKRDVLASAAITARPPAPSCGTLGVAVDAAGNLYIADTNNYRVRKVSNGVITTVAGNGTAGFSGDSGPATSAQLHYPQGVAVDSAGNLYIVDNGLRPQSFEWRDHHRGGNRDGGLQRRQRPGHQCPGGAGGRGSGCRRQPVHRRPNGPVHPQSFGRGDHLRGGDLSDPSLPGHRRRMSL